MKPYYEYKGYFIFPCKANSSGMKYYTLTDNGIVKADTLKGIKELIK